MGPLVFTPITCYQGVDLDLEFLFFGEPANGSTDVQDEVPLDLTGATARMMIRQTGEPGSPLLQSLTTGAGLTLVSGTFTPGPPMPSVPNGVRIQITRAQSLAMNGGVGIREAYYDLLFDMPGGTTILALAGVFNLLSTVTR